MDEQFMRSTQNMDNFRQELESKVQKPRFGQFSQPLPLTVGDSSTYYNKLRKDKHEVGQLKCMMTNKCKGTKDTFGKFQTNAIGDEYQDAGQYFLRKDRKARPQSQGAQFRPSGCNQKVRKSEFQYKELGPPQRPEVEKAKNFVTRFSYDPFQKVIPYMESEYNRKEELIKNDYIMRRSQIINPKRPYTSTVKQRGTFYDTRKTFGTDKQFSEKPQQTKKPPLFGPFKTPDLPHTGYNQTIGRNWPYMEDPEKDPIMFKKNIKTSIWKGPTYSQSSPIHTIQNYFRNTNKEYAQILGK